MSLLLVSTFVLIIFIRVLKQFYSSGDHGIRLAKPNAPLIEIIPGSMFILSFFISSLIVILNALGFFAFENRLPGWLMNIGAVIGFSGILITIVAQWQMGNSWRIGTDQKEETELISRGLYAKSRNPIYFGILLYWLGLVLTFTHPIMLACAAISYLCIEVIVRKIEEPYLLGVHGKRFSDYCAHTRRYLPL